MAQHVLHVVVQHSIRSCVVPLSKGDTAAVELSRGTALTLGRLISHNIVLDSGTLTLNPKTKTKPLYAHYPRKVQMWAT